MPLEFELEDSDWSQLVRKETPDAILNHLAHQRDELARQLARIDELFDREYGPTTPTVPTTPAPPRAVAVTKSGFLGATEINDFLREHNFVVAEGVELPDAKGWEGLQGPSVSPLAILAPQFSLQNIRAGDRFRVFHA